MRPLLIALVLTMLAAPAAPAAAPPEDAFLGGLLCPGPTPETLLVRSYPDRPSISSYDGALATLWLMERGRRDEAGRLLAGMAALQYADGALPFSFELPAPRPEAAYVRSGAMAWVGYAAARYLNDAPEGPHRAAIAAMAHRLAAYMLAHRVTAAGDPREGLVMGGAGRYRYEVTESGIRETLMPGELTWASTEHNIDVYFFLRQLARATENPRYQQGAEAVAGAIVARLWDEPAGQCYQGVDKRRDATRALDCASWGALFLLAIGDPSRAERAYLAAEKQYAVTEPERSVGGHRPYIKRPLIENRALAEHFSEQLPVREWDAFPAVWPEGSAGVALAAWRLGYFKRAREILGELDKLRDPQGGLPCLTREIPMEFTSASALAGTAWVSLVRAEMASGPSRALIWGR
jgi:hypothetical protein